MTNLSPNHTNIISKLLCIIFIALTMSSCLTTGFIKKRAELQTGFHKSRVSDIMGNPQYRSKINGHEIWQYCQTGDTMLDGGDAYVAILFKDGVILETKNYTNTLLGYCTSFFRSPDQFVWSSIATKSEKYRKVKKSGSGSGFFVSKLGYVLTNNHVVDKCKKITFGDNPNNQVLADLVETDKTNDLALLKVSTDNVNNDKITVLLKKLDFINIPIAENGLLRSENVDLGEDILVAGYPYGDAFSSTIKVTKGIVSSKKGIANDTGQFQVDAAVQSGNSGGPIYDDKGNIVGMVIYQLNKIKLVKETGSLPENVNFGIKSSSIKQFLSTAGFSSKWSYKDKRISTKELAKIAEKQTVMIKCKR